MKKLKATYLWATYTLAIPFIWLLNLPLIGRKLQLPEIAFLPVFLKSITKIDLAEIRSRSWYRLLDVAVLTWPLAQMIACAANGFTKASIAETLGAAYLVALYFCMRLLADRELLGKLQKYLIGASLLAAAMGMIGWSLSTFFSYHTRMVWPSTVPYPYFGKVARAQGFMPSPNMLASVLMVGIILQFGRLVHRRKPCWKSVGVLVILSLCFVMTFSKTVVCLAAGCAIAGYLAWHPTKGRSTIRLLLFSFVAFCALTYTVVCHVVTSPVAAQDLPLLIKEGYISDKPLMTFRMKGKDYGIYPTNYTHNKSSSIEALKSSKGLGLGGGNYNAFIEGLQAARKHPHWFPAWDPHSTYFGALAELGILGFISVALLGFALVRLIFYDLLKRAGRPDVLLCGLAGIFVAVVLEAICTDVMNFRQYWLLIAAARSLADAPRGSPAEEQSDTSDERAESAAT